MAFAGGWVVSFSMCGVCVGSVVSESLRPHALWPARLLCPWDFPGKNPGVAFRSPTFGQQQLPALPQGQRSGQPCIGGLVSSVKIPYI